MHTDSPSLFKTENLITLRELMFLESDLGNTYSLRDVIGHEKFHIFMIIMEEKIWTI